MDGYGVGIAVYVLAYFLGRLQQGRGIHSGQHESITLTLKLWSTTRGPRPTGENNQTQTSVMGMAGTTRIHCPIQAIQLRWITLTPLVPQQDTTETLSVEWAGRNL